MKKLIKTILTESEFRQIIREEVRAVLDNEDKQIAGLNNEGFINAKQAAEFLKLKIGTIYNLVNKNSIPYHKKPGSNRVLFSKKELSDIYKK
jgi:excisionase family DNA binding protein